jgi:hypothetical protein
MGFIKTLTITIITLVIITSCEKEIDLNLDESPQKYIIEAIVHDSLGDNYVIISKTRPFDDNGAIESVSNANVQIKDNQGNISNLYETSPGYYTDSALAGIANRTYFLTVNVDDKVISASSNMRERVNIDSLTYEFESGMGGHEEGYRMKCYFTDPINIENFYRIKVFVGSKQQAGFISFTDEFFDGNSTFYPVRGSSFSEGEQVSIELLSIDEVNHRYFTAINASQGGDVPGNPISNLNHEDAVGYFGAYAKSINTTIITP